MVGFVLVDGDTKREGVLRFEDEDTSLSSSQMQVVLIRVMLLTLFLDWEAIPSVQSVSTSEQRPVLEQHLE